MSSLKSLKQFAVTNTERTVGKHEIWPLSASEVNFYRQLRALKVSSAYFVYKEIKILKENPNTYNIFVSFSGSKKIVLDPKEYNAMTMDPKKIKVLGIGIIFTVMFLLLIQFFKKKGGEKSGKKERRFEMVGNRSEIQGL